MALSLGKILTSNGQAAAEQRDLRHLLSAAAQSLLPGAFCTAFLGVYFGGVAWLIPASAAMMLPGFLLFLLLLSLAGGKSTSGDGGDGADGGE
ncbi:hypothetical protein [Thermobifida cellulosilytica]|uniref:Uncharacterized protein n=1 Tax=Thermobifida cellulosilytica TB100 TaxID=665004 RepID=A0A147KFE5_THECS|nr:hypothetical protein [Thermobifida cellulosilytica]KUP96012.1 hypothetical protein AC529_14500 [Thermobifida cellulosilytica TB100]